MLTKQTYLVALAGLCIPVLCQEATPTRATMSVFAPGGEDLREGAHVYASIVHVDGPRTTLFVSCSGQLHDDDAGESIDPDMPCQLIGAASVTIDESTMLISNSGSNTTYFANGGNSIGHTTAKASCAITSGKATCGGAITSTLRWGGQNLDASSTTDSTVLSAETYAVSANVIPVTILETAESRSPSTSIRTSTSPGLGAPGPMATGAMGAFAVAAAAAVGGLMV